MAPTPTPSASNGKSGAALSVPEAIDPEKAAADIKKKRLADLLEGKVDPPNDFAAYLIEEVRSILTKGRATFDRLTQLRKELEQLEQDGLRLEGAASKGCDDIMKWDRPLSPDTSQGETNEPVKNSA